MSTVYVRDVSEDALAIMKRRAAQAQQSLQVYVRDLIEREARLSTLEEAAAQARLVAATNSPSVPVRNVDILDAIDAGRSGR